MAAISSLRLDPKRVLTACLFGIVALAIMHTISVVAYVQYDFAAKGALNKFNMDEEQAVPTWIAVVILLAGSLCALGVRAVEAPGPRRLSKYWLALAVVLAVFSVDEVVAMHEWTNRFELFGGGSGVLYFSWVILGMALVVVMALLSLPFLIRVDRRTRGLLLLSGVFYFGGAIGVEMMNADVASAGLAGSMRYGLGSGVEECLELLGASIMLYTLLDLLQRQSAVFTLTITPARSSADDAPDRVRENPEILGADAGAE